MCSFLNKKVFMRNITAQARLAMLRLSALLAAAIFTALALAHSVGQVQTTKFLAPETVAMLLARAGTASPGLRNGDIMSYIIQFSPIANGATTGVAGYITDYLPPGTEVVDAAIVAKDAAGNFYSIPPNFPGGIDPGWGNQGQKTYLAPFATAAYDATGRCAAGGFTNNCNARLTELHADTGIFFSTDPRTAVFPALPTRILQGLNGYDISPTAEGQLNPIIGQTRATTHNLWDANQTNAFGSTPAAVGALVAPASVAPSINVTGRGATPYNAGSAVAGPQTGYQLDNTASVGPWQRIAYAGSRIGDSAIGPATAADPLSLTAVGGAPTSIGYNLSTANPLPSGTNAVRWAVGKLVVGEIRYVKISLRITAPPPTNGIVNSSEVFGGDAGDADNGQDSVWRYHVPSVADNNSNLLVQKTVECVFIGAVCQPLSGGYIPDDARVRYRLTYLNSGVVPQTNVVLEDVLPCKTGANAASFILSAVISGSITLPVVNPPITAAGVCPATRSTVTFPTLSTLAPGAGGAILIDIQMTTAVGDLVANTAKLKSDQVPGGVFSNTAHNVNAFPSLAITKVANVTTTVPGGTTSYTIVVENTGAGNATGIAFNDILPSLGGAVTPATRFSFNTVTSVAVSASPAGSALTLPAVVTTGVPPTLIPYDTSPVASNSQQITFSFGASTLVPGGRITLTYTVNVGVSVTASATPYFNSAIVTYAGGGTGRSDAPNTAPVLVTSPLSVTKTIDCYFVGLSCVPIGPGGSVPANARIRYTISYANTGAATINNAILSDTLPCQTAANVASNIQTIAGPIGLPVPNPPLTAAGVCPATRSTFSFPPTTLLAGQTGTVKVDVQTNAAVGAVIVNTAGLSAAGFPSSSSEVQASVAAQPVLQINKVANTAAVAPGGTLSYTITLTNVGTTAAQTITVFDWLPTGTSTVADPTRRFSYVSTSNISGFTSVAPTVNLPPTQPPYNAVGTNPFLSNQQEVAWNFGSQTLAPGASASITFVVQVGAALPISPPTYDNYARASFSGGAVNSGLATAQVLLMANLSVTKNNGTNTLVAGSTTSYTVTYTNGGPSPANGALIKDSSSAGLQCTSVTCAATTGGASCPTSMPLPLGTLVLRVATNFFSSGETIPTFPANSSVSLLVNCGVLASGQ
jgi:uncharacterized repeat protein (TIGR01451 family)